MKKLLFASILFSSAFCLKSEAQESVAFPKGEISTTDIHTGTIWLSEFSKPDSILNFSVAMETYAPESKLDWHIHPAGQILLITKGMGYYQEEGKPAQIIHKGDVIRCLPGVPHGHGSSPGNSFAYIAFTPAQKGRTIWLKRLTEAEYHAAK